MARSQGEKLDDLMERIATLTERVDNVRIEFHRLEEIVSKQSAEPLYRQVAAHSERLDQMAKSFEKTNADMGQLTATVSKCGEIAGGLDKRLALVEHQLAALKKEQEETSRKRWTVIGPVAGAIVSVLLAALISFFVSRR